MIFRNDDVAWGCDIPRYREIQAIFENFGIKETYSVVPVGQNIYSHNPHLLSKRELENKLGLNLVTTDEQVDRFIKESLQRGHSISLHGWIHTDVVRYSYVDQLNHIKEARDILENAYQTTIKYFVPPFNSYSDETVRACYQLGLQILGANNNQLEWLVRDNCDFTGDPYCWYHAWRFTES